jgi:hypothetical protein
MKRSIAHHATKAFIYLLSLSIYLHPLTHSPTPSRRASDQWSLITHPQPQLDELHLVDAANTDVNPKRHDDSGTDTNSWKEALRNDYWGRPLDSSSSHKSWRPVSVWSFRFAKGQQSHWCRWIVGFVGRFFGRAADIVLSLLGLGSFADSTTITTSKDILASELFTHRFVNVLLHTCLVQVLGVVSLLLFPDQYMASYIAQILFALHPTHVEAVANAANRPHVLGLLLNLSIVDPSFPLVGVAMCNAAALLSAETALFHLPAIICMMGAVRYRELLDAKKSKDNTSDRSILSQTIIGLIPRYAILALTTTLYLTYRLFNSSLSIPSGLIRPAENPFYNKLSSWSTTRRFANYGYITSLHVMKSLGVEIVGMSHEYGYDCVPEMKVGMVEGVPVLDLRLGLPFVLVVCAFGLCLWCWFGGSEKPTKSANNASNDSKHHGEEDRTMRILLLLVFFAWMATLFPIAGILKVGTFIADRIVVASTVGTCIFGGRVLAIWIVGLDETKTQSSQRARVIRTILVLIMCMKYLGVKTHARTAEWMDSVPLLESSLQACPRSIKSNLEMSKLYSGLVPHMIDFKRALTLIETAHKIDPAYCDVHQQYGHVYFQQGRYIPFEKAMVQSLMCPFTMGQAMTNWKRYWNAVLTPRNGVTDVEARKRYDGYMKRIEESIEKEAEIAAEEDYEKRLRDGDSHLADEL